MLRDTITALASKYCCPLMRLFKNPYHLSGVVFAMLLTNIATLLWAILILAQDSVLKRAGSSYAFVTNYVDENIVAACFGMLALLQLACLWLHLKPTRFRNIGYFLMAMAWGFVFFHSITNTPVIFPTATSLSFAMAFASFYAWLDGPDHGAS